MPNRSFITRGRILVTATLSTAAIVALGVAGCRTTVAPVAPVPTRAERVQREHIQRIDALIATLARLDSALRTAPATAGGVTTVRGQFVAARTAYKQVEPLVELYLPTTADLINGPALDDMPEDDPSRVLPPEGFQVIEEALFPAVNLADDSVRTDLRNEVRILLANVRRVRDDAEGTPLTDAAVFDAARLQLVRVFSLGLAGFDSPIALLSVPEAAAAVTGVRAMLLPYDSALREADEPLAASLQSHFASTVARLQETARRPDAGFHALDRMQFYVQELRPLAATILRAQLTLGVANPSETRAWRASVASPFESEAFDAMFFAPVQRKATSAAEVALGEALFNDPVLSANGNRTCATCHQPASAFQDGKATSLPARGATPGSRRNAPTLLNSALQNASFHDLRTVSLEDQITAVIGNHEEMHASLAAAARSAAGRSDIVERFATAYAVSPTTAVTPARLRDALAAYLRSLTSLDAPFDRAMRGDSMAITDEARRGFSVFMGKGKCGTCHFAPLFNGAVPPLYQKTESEVIGVPSRPVLRHATIDADPGRFAISGLAIHRHAFKTPTLRNIAVTAPYMHNGVYRTLEEVVEFYDRGGGAGIGAALPNQTLPPEPLHLTTAEKRALVAFMHTLTDTASLRTR